MPDRTIRPSVMADLTRLLEIYEDARRLMRETGNPTQWITNPRRELLEKDIQLSRGYVVEEEGHIIGTFAFIIGEDPTYRVLDGTWLNGAPYGTIHRIAGVRGAHGILQTATAWAFTRIDNIRIDTHPNNAIMLHLLPKCGYTRCGTIFIQDDVSNHSPRIAFQQERSVSRA